MLKFKLLAFLLVPLVLIAGCSKSQNEMEKCYPKFKIESGPELTASESYASECLSKKSEAECAKVDVYAESTNTFGNKDGMPDCYWITNLPN